MKTPDNRLHASDRPAGTNARWNQRDADFAIDVLSFRLRYIVRAEVGAHYCRHLPLAVIG